MAKNIIFAEEAREKILKGARIVAEAVGSTLGPKANNVAIQRPFGGPSVIHDGVSVAKEIELADSSENIGAQLVIEAAQKTNDKAGDGTTTSTILTYAIAKEANKNIAAGSNPMFLRKGMELAKDFIIDQLKKLAKPIETDEEIKQIATISAQDEQIGTLIYSAIKKLGKECIIAVEESPTAGMSIEYKQGMQFDKGWVSPYFVTNPQTGESVIEDAWILITDTKITSNSQFVEWAKNLETVYTASIEGTVPNLPKNIVIIANEVSGIALASLIQNKIQGFANIVAIQSPSHGLNQKGTLEDIAVVTGGTFISEDTGGSISSMSIKDYGRAKRIVSTKSSTMIVDGFGEEKAIASRIKELTATNTDDLSEFDRENLRERIAKLTSGIAVINVGGASDAEMKEKKERCIDAIEATQAAIEEGIVPGGQVAYLSCSLDKFFPETDNLDIQTGIKLTFNAIRAPFRILMENSGYDAGQMLERLQNAKEGEGIDVTDGQIKDVVKAGIIDPVKVSRVALENAVSTAGAIVTTNCLISEEKKDVENAPGT